MKKIFGVLSLMAIMMVAFTPQAIAVDTDYQTEFVVTHDRYDFVTVESVKVATFFGVINVTDEPVNYLSAEGFIPTNIVSWDLYNFNTTLIKFSDLPFEVGWKL